MPELARPVVIEAGLAGLPDVLRQLGSRRVLVLTGGSGRFVDRLVAVLGEFEVEVFGGARRHVPVDVVEAADQRVGSSGADTVLTLGGGAATGLGKALRLRHGRKLRFVAVPTTYAGSEFTSIYGLTRAGKKETGRDPDVCPDVVLQDVDLTLNLPRALTVSSLMNAFAHPFSALSTGSLDADERAHALEIMSKANRVTEDLLGGLDNREARARALRVCRQAAQTLESGTLGDHHKLVHAIGGRFDLDHSQLHSLILPHSVHLLRERNPELAAEATAAIGAADLEAALFDLLIRADTVSSLKGLGLQYADVTAIAEGETSVPAALLYAAYHGRRPDWSFVPDA